MANAKLGTKAVGSIVKLKVNGTAKEFLVVHQGKPSSEYDESCNGTWLLMKDCYEGRQWNSFDENKYESSTINSYLNSTFIGLFDSAVQGIIKQVKIPYRKGGGSGGTNQSGANGLSAKIFLLSGYEIGWTTDIDPYIPVDGVKLAYFESGTSTSAQNKRIAYLNGSAIDWWLRSMNGYTATSVWFVDSAGGFGTRGVSASLGIRPAFILPSTTLVDDSGNVVTVDLTAHKTIVNGTAYDVKGGKCLVNGTAYSIKKGRTLINGTGYDINFEPDVRLTWTFNLTVNSPASTPTFLYANFTSNGTKFKAFNCDVMAGALNLSYLYLNQDASHTQLNVYYYNWQNEAYRTVTFDEAPSGDLLTWLQANATPQ